MHPLVNLILFILGIVLLGLATAMARGIGRLFPGGVFVLAAAWFLILLDQGQFNGAL